MRSKAAVFQEHFDLIKLTLPYFAPDVTDIPTYEEIRRAMRKKDVRMDGFGSHRPVCKIGNMIVKADVCASLFQKTEDLLWLQQNTQVRVPKLYAVFSRYNPTGSRSFRPWWEDTEIAYLVMEYVKGATMDWPSWQTLTFAQQEKIHCCLAEQINILRSVPSPGYYGRVNDQGWYPVWSPTSTRGRTIGGPYKTYVELTAAMYSAAEMRAAGYYPLGDVTCPVDENWSKDQEACLSEFRGMFTQLNNHEPKLTHSDPSMRNWIVDPMNSPSGSLQDATDYLVTFIDWNGMGWYPAWTQRKALLDLTLACYFEPPSYAEDVEGGQQFQKRVDQYFDEEYEDFSHIKKLLFETLDYDI